MTSGAQSSCAAWATCACSGRCSCQNLHFSSPRYFQSQFTAWRSLCMLWVVLMPVFGIQYIRVGFMYHVHCLVQPVHANGHAHARAWRSIQSGASQRRPVPRAICACWQPSSCQSQACSKRRALNVGVLGGTDMLLAGMCRGRRWQWVCLSRPAASGGPILRPF